MVNEDMIKAIATSNKAAMVRMIELGAQPNNETQLAGVTALIRAVLLSDTALVKKLVQKGCGVNHLNQKGMSAMSWACKVGDPVMVETLMDLDADPGIEGKNGMTPLMWAMRHNRKEVIEGMMEHLFRNPKQGPRAADRVLNYQNRLAGMSALMMAAQHRQV